jgi:hypothetical protein
MPLAAGVKSFADELISIEKAAYPTVGDTARAFAHAFANFLGFGNLLTPPPPGVPVTPGSNLGPAGIEACGAALIPAFTAPNTPASSSAAMQAAFIAYFNAMPVSTMWANAVSVAPVGAPLGSIITVSMVPGIASPKVTLANGIMQWLGTGAQVTLNAAPWTAFIG